MRLWAAAGLLWTMVSLPTRAQTGGVGGTVLRDSAGHALAESEITLPALKRTVRTNYLGEFRIDGVPAGTHVIVIRHVGFAPYTDSVVVRAGQVLDREFVLTEQPVTLDSQKVSAVSVASFPFARDFEQRRKTGFGKFVDTDELRKIEGGRPLMNYLASRIPGMTLYRPDPKGHPTDWYLSSGHGRAEICPVALFIDASPVYIYRSTPGLPPDVAQWSADDYAAVEYYAGGTSAPPQFNITGSDCGVLLLWRRYR